eukprot:TRINITY_DN23850_c0_g1_i1.p1 TRINITY_DN23850_c0_g1~~TRINITY_DN23850_c0_g1_i1.p1  ORF type:complete len:625 (-),score=103.94 TRINITY_DN23850_c0_g1_i1:463-2337(-)
MVPPRNVFPDLGTKFGNEDDLFQLDEELGGGSQGRVFKCIRLQTSNVYACKIVNIEAIGLRSRTVDTLKREISVMRELHHPRIVNLQDAFWKGALCYIVMDLAAGGDLHGKLKPGRGLGHELAARHVSFQLLEGIAYMHLHKVIHRDLKPENVLIVCSRPGAEEGCVLHDVKIGDFGLSKCLKRVGVVERGMTACGTLDYLAPEVLTEHYDERIDFWSFGVLLYVMLCGDFPFEINAVTDLQALYNSSKLNSGGVWATLTGDAQDMVQGLLTIDPAQRLDQVGCRRHPWLAAEVARTPVSGVVSSSGEESSDQRSPAKAAQGDSAGYNSSTFSAEPLRSDALSLLEREAAGAQAASSLPKPALRFWERRRKSVIQQIQGSVGNAVDNVELRFRSGRTEVHGGQGGFQHRSWRLHHDEVILAIAQEERDTYIGNSLVFFTSACQIIALQGADARARNRLVAPIGSQITGLQFEDSCVTGIYLEHLPSDGGPMAVEQVTGYVGSAVDQVSLHLRDGSVRRHGVAGGTPVGPWTLEPDEFILLVEQGRRDAFLGNSLVFFTSKGNIIELRGLQAARSRRFVAPPGSQICGLGFDGSLLSRVQTCPLLPSKDDANCDEVKEHTIGVGQ